MTDATDTSKRRRWPPIAVAVLLLAAAGGAAWLLAGADGPITEPPDDGADDGPPPIVQLDRDGFRFTYHVPTGSEGLFSLEDDPDFLNNLARARPELAAEMRAALCEDLGVASLDELKDNFSEHIERLRGLGYL